MYYFIKKKFSNYQKWNIKLSKFLKFLNKILKYLFNKKCINFDKIFNNKKIEI